MSGLARWVLKVNRLHEADVCAGEIGIDQAWREIAGGSQPRSDRSEYVFNEWLYGLAMDKRREV
jgi:hypothetical protein